MELVTTTPTINQRERDILNKIVAQSIETSSELVEHFFSSTDDLFYELSERSSTNNEENLYFEAMRAIRVSKNDLESEFLGAIRTQFERIPELAKAPNETNRSENELAMVEREDLEIELAQKNMADRTRDTYKQELFDLESRLKALLTNCPLSAHNNPLEPLNLSKCFVHACTKHLGLEIKTRLIFFKLFEKHFLKQLGHLYANANKILIEEGILPKVSRKNSTQEEGAPQTAIEQQEQEPPESFQSFPEEAQQPFQLEQSALATLMSSIRAARQSNNPLAKAFTNYQDYSANPGTVMPVIELADLLTNTQKDIDQKISIDSPQNLVPQIVTDILAFKDPSEPQALDQPNEDVINLVALFFDKVLEDENLPIAIQSLICRLQIPILKVALHDKTFLTDKSHPARTLINTITRAGLSLDESRPAEKDPIFKTISEGVQKVNQLYATDTAIFSEVNDLLIESMRSEQKKSETVESRTQQTESGKARLKAAKSFAQNTIYEKLKDTKIPLAISDFLTNHWLQVLVITFVRSGNDSNQWVENEQLISDLIWVSQRYDDEKSTFRQQRLTHDVLQRIEEGLALTIDDPNERKSKTEEVESALKIIESELPSEQIFREINKDHIDKLGKADPEKKSWDEMTALERQQARYEELSSQSYLDAKNMPIDTWLEYTDQEKGKVIRCKLSAKIDADNYVFVNRFGMKALVRSRRQFAYDMQFKKAKVLETGPVFERLMNKVMTQIKSISQEI